MRRCHERIARQDDFIVRYHRTMKLDGIAAFAAIAESGSVSGAARKLNVAKSVVSERLKELERELGAHLVQRTTRRLTITAEGSAFLEHAQRILREATDAR